MSREVVVMLHGVWMPASEMLYVKRRFEAEHGFECYLFDYPSVSDTLDDNARRLREFVREFEPATLHLVGHSLGGLVALRLLATHDDVPAGRVVCLGSPLTGSRTARGLGRFRWGDAIMGHSLPQAALEPASVWARPVPARPVAVNVPLLRRPSGTGRGPWPCASR